MTLAEMFDMSGGNCTITFYCTIHTVEFLTCFWDGYLHIPTYLRVALMPPLSPSSLPP